MKHIKSILTDVIRLFLPAGEGDEYELSWGAIAGGVLFIVLSLLMAALASGSF